MSGYTPPQSLVFLVTNTDGHIKHEGMDLTPYTIYATFLGDMGRIRIFEHSQTDGLNVRTNEELTDRIWKESDDPIKQTELRGMGLVPTSRIPARPHGKLTFYQYLDTNEIGCVFWIPDEYIRILDKKQIQYKVLNKTEGSWPAPQPTQKEAERRMRDYITKPSKNK